MNKKDRQKIFDKYCGKCAYCGCELPKRWHADHLDPIHRKTKTIGGNFVTKDTGLQPTELDIKEGNYMQIPRKTVPNGCHKPQNDTIENLMPSCVSCNLYKHSADLETFRTMLNRTIKSLSDNSTPYQFSKRYGLIQETGIEVKFYFETLNLLTMTELKDVLHLYNNPFNKVKVLVDDDEVKYLWDVDVAEGGDYVNITLADKEFRSINGDDDGWNVYNDDETLSRIKPILRKLSDMTQEEAEQLRKYNEIDSVIPCPHFNSIHKLKHGEQLRYLLSKHFDLFGLIESGQAIDKTSLIGGKQEEVKI